MSATNESLRQLYLRELGISSYFPRFTLPGAGSSHAWLRQPPTPSAGGAQDEESAAPASCGADAATGKLRSRTAADQQAGLQNALITAAIAPELAASPELKRRSPLNETRPESSAEINTDNIVGADSASPASAAAVGKLPLAHKESDSEVGSQPAPEFAFVWFAPHPHLAVIVELPSQQQSGRLPPGCRELLVKMLAAVTPGMDTQASLSGHSFRWPIDDAVADTGVDAAQQVLSGFISRRLKDFAARYILVFSEQAPGYLYLSSPEAVPARGQLGWHPEFEVQLLHTYSLQDIVRDNTLKRPVWESLKVLKSRLEQLSAVPEAAGQDPGGNNASHV